MRYFNNIKAEENTIFYRAPESFKRSSSKELLAYGLGPTLYMPATREMLLKDLIKEKLRGLISLVICLEDAIPDTQVQQGEENLINQMKGLQSAQQSEEINQEEVPLIFIRVRSLEQMKKLMLALEDHPLLTGFVFPKFNIRQGRDYFNALRDYNNGRTNPIFGMPILEDKNIIYKESRIANLLELKELLDSFKDLVLNIRIGATDFSRLFGLRRSSETTLYDIMVLRDCIADIVNVFSRCDDEYVISGSVWEYFSPPGSILDPAKAPLAGLIREAQLDRENGLWGKTIIHPSQILPVQALQVVSHEDYLDALRIQSLENNDNGVVKSQYGNKMNEVKPHLSWANKIIKRAALFGVFHEGRSYLDLLR
ncbi:HpcH/HpaI aldolase/citrate lyase family protein [Alkaliphilus crotonatoxidans]